MAFPATRRPATAVLPLLAVPVLTVLLLSAAPAADDAAKAPRPGDRVARRGDEIVVCGQLFHTTTPVVLWTDPGGYDAYRVERRFVPPEEASWAATKDAKTAVPKSPNRYGMRTKGLSAERAEKVRGGWELDDLREVVDQFVVHFDACGTSKKCFEVLHDQRGLSVQFMLDVDGTLYQTLDLKEAAWHATVANNRSIGIEIANVGAYNVKGPSDKTTANGKTGGDPLARWYAKGADGKTRLTIPGGLENSGVRNKALDLRPDRGEPVVGEIQGQTLRQYDLTPQQYEALTKLTATLCTVFPKIKCDYPHADDKTLVTRKLPDDRLKAYQGVLGHYHVQTNKVDPGPAFQWDRVIDGARALMAH